MSRRLTTAEFINKARQIHGDRYDYSQAKYVNSNTKITLICPDHGAFTQTPNNHLRNHGCPDCAGKKQLTTETFIEKAQATHGDRYDYSKVDYVSAHMKVTIICPNHGPFEQSAHSHRRGQGCPDCGRLVTEDARRLTTAEFIEKAKAIHGDRYDYSQVEYTVRHTKVTIVCPEHGRFSQTPGSHLNGRGCPHCAGNHPLTTESFVDGAKAVHGDRYDYSQAKYVNNNTKVTIICLEHGSFMQTPNNHLENHGCPDCGGNRPLTTESFIENSKAIHGDRYDYSQVEYQNIDAKVTIVCRDHGPFRQTAYHHLGNHGCPECGGVKRLTTETFIEKAKAIHGDRYDYSQVNYITNATPVTIICAEHGAFSQKPNSHLSAQGCPECAWLSRAESNRSTTAEFIERAREVHGDRYDYSRVEYVKAFDKVTIICPEHGPFQQNPINHIHQKSGCPDCAKSGFNPSEPGTLYYVAVETDDGDTRYKIGITNRAIEERFQGSDLARIRIVKTWRYTVGRKAAEREAEILRQYAGDKYYGPDILLFGNTELFTHDILSLDK